jgi:uncharacterized protein (TIGR00297 family)
MMKIHQLLLGLILGVGISALAYTLGSLTLRGALAAATLGGLTYGIGGWMPAVLLLTFFVTSSALSYIGAAGKVELASTFSKGGRRDYAQVLANGSLATVLAVAYGLSGQVICLIGLSGALAATSADTWATELGVLARTPPRLITTGLPVEAGTSGGVTLAGSLAAACGAGFIGLLVSAMQGAMTAFPIVVLAGVVGAVIDSLLGASVQAMYWCSRCGRETEHTPQHTCGTQTQHVRGWRWLTNDGVNFTATVVGATVAILGWSLL